MIDVLAIKNKVLNLAICGGLTDQNSEESADHFYSQLQDEKESLIKAKKIKREKALSEVSETERSFDIPQNWRWVRLGQICLQITDGTHKTPKYQDDGVPFLSVKNISSGCLDLSDIKYISEEEHTELIKRCRPERDDVLVCRIGTLGKALRIDTDIEFSVFVSLGLVKTGNKTLSDYICCVINSGYGSEWIEANKAGGAMHTYKINLNDLKMMPIPLPPIEEQERILECVDEITKHIGVLCDMQDKYRKDIELLKSKIIDAGIQGLLTERLPEDGSADDLFEIIQTTKKKLMAEGKIKKDKAEYSVSEDAKAFSIPDTWKWVCWGEIVNIVSARRVHQSDWRKEGIPFYRAREIAKLADVGSVNNDLYISEELYTDFSKSGVPQPGDLMVSAVGTLGKTYVVQEGDQFYYKDASVLCIENYAKIDPYYLRYVMNSNLMRKQIESNSGGTTVDTLTMVRMVKYVLPLPPLAEQHRIAEIIDEILSIA